MQTEPPSKKEIMTVTASVYKLTQNFSKLRAENDALAAGDPREKEISAEMDIISLGVMNHLLLNELRVIDK